MPRTVAVFGSSATAPDTDEYEQAWRLGALLAEAGWVVATGGYGGTMEAVSAGAAANGGTVIGVTAPTVFPGRPGPNQHVQVEIPAASIGERIHRLVDMADAAIALPGSIGTVAEFVLAWNVNFVATFSEARVKPVVAVGDGYDRLIALLAADFGADTEFVQWVATADEAAAAIGSAN